MRIMVMGTGGVGGYYGAMLAHAGNQVTFVARGAHLAAIQARGLELRTQGKTIRVQPATAVEDPTESGGELDLVLFTVKTYDTETAARAVKPALGPQAAVLTLQNGVDSADLLGGILGPERILAGATFIASAVAAPGIVEENGFSRRVIFGELAGDQITPRVQRIAEVFREAGLDVETTASARQTFWDKFVLVAPHATVSSLCQTPLGVTRRTPEAMELYRRMAREVMAVGQAAGLNFAADTPDRIVATFMGAPEGQMSSMQRDFAAQRRVEVDALTGAVVRQARQLGVETPCFDALYAVLKVWASARGPRP